MIDEEEFFEEDEPIEEVIEAWHRGKKQLTKAPDGTTRP